MVEHLCTITNAFNNHAKVKQISKSFHKIHFAYIWIPSIWFQILEFNPFIWTQGNQILEANIFWQVTIEQEQSEIDFGSGNRIIKWLIKSFLIWTGIDFLQHESLINLSYGVNKRRFAYKSALMLYKNNSKLYKILPTESCNF